VNRWYEEGPLKGPQKEAGLVRAALQSKAEAGPLVPRRPAAFGGSCGSPGSNLWTARPVPVVGPGDRLGFTHGTAEPFHFSPPRAVD
jgi:hypothetical protein